LETNALQFSFCLQLVQAKRVKHCKLCEACMLEMDHHCLFLLRCVAGGNHCLFTWLIIMCVLCQFTFCAISYLYVIVMYGSLFPILPFLWTVCY
jgi:hypothetical protein